MLPESDHKDLAIQALARSTMISDLSGRNSVSRQSVHQQAHKARAASNEVFLSGTPENGVPFYLTVSKTSLRQVISALTRVCRSSYRGGVELLRDRLGVPISIGMIHHVLRSVASLQNRARNEKKLESAVANRTHPGEFLISVSSNPSVNTLERFATDNTAQLKRSAHAEAPVALGTHDRSVVQ